MPRLRNRAQLAAAAPDPSLSPSPPLSRPPRRAAARRSEELTSITVDNVKEPDSPEATITLKMPAARGRPSKRGQGAVMDSRESYGSAASLRAPRSTRAKRVVIDSESDEDEDADADGDADIDDEEDDDDEDAAGEDEEMEDVGDEDAEGEDDDDADADADADGDDDVDMIATPAPPTRRQAAVAAAATPVKPTLKVTPAPPTQSVEEKEMQMAAASIGTSDDEELSELPSGEEREEDEEEDDEEEEEGEDEMEMGEEEEEEMDGDGETDDELAGLRTPNSRESTPDVTKMTKRQRGRLEQQQEIDDNFLQLPMEPQIKKHLTAEEHAMRRAEMARRRKNLSEKRNEEEKMDTINRLLKKQAPKRRGKLSAAELAAGTDTPDPTASAEGGDDDAPPRPADPVFTRWVSGKDGISLSIPIEWKDVQGVQNWAGSQHWRAPVAVEEVEG